MRKEKLLKQYVLVVIGAGGTGSYFLKEFSRFISGTHSEESFLGMYIFDGDTVEQKNLARQCFCEEDIGRNKAAVMAEVLNDAYDLQFVAKGTYLTEISQLRDVTSIRNYFGSAIPIIVSCVDNHGCRLLLEDFFANVSNCVYLDSANEFDTGEVVFSYKFKDKVIGPVRSTFFPDIRRGDVRSRVELSCEELNNVAPQHIFTNMMAGNLLCSGVANLLSGIVTPGFTYFNALKYEATFCPWKAGGENA